MKKDLRDDASLMKRSLLEDLKEEERLELERLLEDQSLREMYGQLSDPSFLKEQFAEYEKYSGKRGYERFRVKRGKNRGRIVRWIVTVAAVWIVALSVSLWLVYRENGTVPLVAVSSVIIPPGTNQAQLTLADGRVVEVASTDVQVQEQNGVQVEYKNGEISYTATAKTTELLYNELNVPFGGECVITLNDGTRVWVNAGTKLRYPVTFTGKRREVILEGEAYFDVVKGKSPFIVKTSFGDVRVLGTAFGVSAYSGDVACYTTLVRGKVSFGMEGEQPVMISPGEQVIATKSGKMEKRAVDVEEFVGWKDGVYVFKEKRLGDLMKTLERWYNISVYFQEEALQDVPFTGNLKRYDDINVFFDALTRTGDLKYKVNGNQVIVYK